MRVRSLCAFFCAFLCAQTCSAGLVYTSSTFSNFTVTQDDLLGFAATADIFESGTKVGVIDASVVYGGGTNPFDSGSIWGAGATFRALGQSSNDNEPNETAAGFWNFDVTPEPGYTVDGISLFTVGTVIANPTFANLTSNGTATVFDANQGTADELLQSHDDGDAFVNGDDLVFNAGSLITGIDNPVHTRNWAYDSAGATNLSFDYLAGPVTNITNEGINIDVQFSVAVPEPSSLWLLGLLSIPSVRSRRRRDLRLSHADRCQPGSYR